MEKQNENRIKEIIARHADLELSFFNKYNVEVANEMDQLQREFIKLTETPLHNYLISQMIKT
jgi:hypothetical protein